MLASTRFNSKTFEEREHYRILHRIVCIYGTPLLIKTSVPLNTLLFVVEMNNEKNQIEGVGAIRNKVDRKRHRVFSDYSYNRFTYRGNYRLTREQLKEADADMVAMLEMILFKGKSHAKRQCGITLISSKVLHGDRVRGCNLTERMKDLFDCLKPIKEKEEKEEKVEMKPVENLKIAIK